MQQPRVQRMGIFVVAALIGLSSFWLSAPLPVEAPATSFSAARAFEHIKTIAKAPHPTGSSENTRVREYLINEMRRLGLDPQQMIGAPNGVRVINLYGELEGANKAPPQILLMAHYDSTPNGPGAADDSTGVAVVLETIRALKSGGPLRNTLGVLLTDGEEVGDVCLGANVFVNSQTNLMSDLRLIVNLEARGNRGPVLMFQTGANNNGIIHLFGAACPLPVAASFSEDVYRHMPNDTDLTEFLKAGKRGLNFAFTSGIEFYHSPQDTPENLSQRTLQHYGACVLPVAKKLAEADDAMLDRCLKPGDATFFVLARGVLVRYPASLARILAIATAIGFVATALLGIVRSRLSLKNVAAALGVNILTFVISALFGIALIFLVTRIFHASAHLPFIVGVPWSNAFLLALILITAAATLWIKTRLLRRATEIEQTAGALILWTAFVLVTNSALPGASYLFMWPTLLATLALWVSNPFRDSILIAILTSAPAALLFAPTILLIHQTITIGTAPLSAALTALALGLIPTANSPGSSPQLGNQ